MSENLIEKLEDLAGRTFGDVECLIHHPLYFIKNYQARVNEKLIRSSWPTEGELAGFKAQGVDTIVNFCAERDQDALVKLYGMFPVNIGVIDSTPPTIEQAKTFIDVVQKSALTVGHCEAGWTRTGCFCAAVRIALDGWTPEAALKEAEGFGVLFPGQKDWILNDARF